MVFSCAFGLFFHRKLFLYKSFYRFIFLVLMAALLFSCGFMVAQIRTIMVHTPVLAKKIGPVDIEGTIELIGVLPGVSSKGAAVAARVVLSDLEIERVNEPPRKIRMKVSKAQGLKIGQRVRMLGVINPPSAPLVPGGFDFARHMYFQGIGGVGFAYRMPEIIEDAVEDEAHFSRFIQALRLVMSAKIMSALPERQGALASALVVGHRTSIDDADRDAMRVAGLAHLLAISGLHVGLVVGILFFCSRLLMACVPLIALRYPIKKYAAVIALVGGVAYMLIAGSTIPTQRAVLMSGVVLCAILFDRMAISLRLVAFAAFVVLLIAPESLLSASFHLSFAAVAALIAFYDGMRPVFLKWNGEGGALRRVGLYLVGVCMTSVVATLATMPFAMFHFHQVASYGLLGNLVAVPLMGFLIMPSGIVAVLLMPFGLEFYPLMLMGIGIEAVLGLAHWIYGLSGALLYVSAWPLSALLCFVTAGLCLILLRGSLRWCALLPLVIVAAVFSSYRLPDIIVNGNLNLVMIRQDEGEIVVSTNRQDKFTRENWQRYFGVENEILPVWPKAKGQGLFCDAEACRSFVQGHKVSLVKTHYAQRTECKWADIVISQEPIQRASCAVENRIGKWEGWRHGSHAVYLGKNHGDIRIVNAQIARGERPWVAHKAKRSYIKKKQEENF